jgi:signal transduction histidine kinase
MERLRLERDLHDGAQQRLLALSYEIRLARAAADGQGDQATASALAQAIAETEDVLDEVRELARGIFPALLTEAGLSTALATLADVAPLPVDMLRVDTGRYAAGIEAAAYFAVAEAVDDAAARNADHAAVMIVEGDGRLVITIEDNGSDRASPMLALTDRVGALGGAVLVEPTACRVELPCA